MRHIFLFLFVFAQFLGACSTGGNAHSANVSEAFEAKRELYTKLYLKATEKRLGYTSKGCDATLYTSLMAVVLGYKKVKALRSNDPKHPGLFLRRAADWEDCYFKLHPDGDRYAKSQTSRDMYTGVLQMLAFYHEDMQAEANQVLEYGLAHKWIMGEGDKFRSAFRASLKATLYLIIEKHRKLYPEEKRASLVPVLITGFETTYERHLAAINITTRGLLAGRMPRTYQDWLDESYREQPGHPLYAILSHKWKDGDYSDAMAAMMDESQWPNDRLPNNHEHHCQVEWVISKDMSSDNWQPCPDEKYEEDTGGAWLYMAALMDL